MVATTRQCRDCRVQTKHPNFLSTQHVSSAQCCSHNLASCLTSSQILHASISQSREPVSATLGLQYIQQKLSPQSANTHHQLGLCWCSTRCAQWSLSQLITSSHKEPGCKVETELHKYCLLCRCLYMLQSAQHPEWQAVTVLQAWAFCGHCIVMHCTATCELSTK